MRTMQTLQDLIEEAKIRTLYWGLCIFAVTYFLTNTSKSMWVNFPIGLLLVSGFRVLLKNVEIHLKFHHPYQRQTYLSHLEKKQLSIHDSRLSTAVLPARWKRKIDSPVVEAAVHELLNKILQDFVIDLWYSDITPDKDAPELIRGIILDALGEVAGRVKELNLVDLLTRDVIDLIGDHLDLYRRNQLAIGVDVMKILSTEERDERLKHHLMNSRELHPALISSESEYKVLQRLAAGVLSVVLRPKEVQCPLVRCIARELITCIVLQPVMDFVSPVYINEVIERLLLETKGNWFTEDSDSLEETMGRSHTCKTSYQENHKTLATIQNHGVVQSNAPSGSLPPLQDKLSRGQPAQWARVLNAATQRRTEVLMPENLENMWSRGKNFKVQKCIRVEGHAPRERSSSLSKNHIARDHREKSMSNEVNSSLMEAKDGGLMHSSDDLNRGMSFEVNIMPGDVKENKIRRSNSTSALSVSAEKNTGFDVEGGSNIITEFYRPNLGINAEESNLTSTSNVMICSEACRAPNIKCRVIGAYFEKIGSKSFAVYSIAVTDAENKTWFVKRRYSNFERLHRHLKDIPNYTLHLPPKRIFSSSTEDAFVHQRCIQLDKYLQDLLSIANVAEQHEVWDFLSVSSKNYSFGKSASVMRTLAVNVDDAMDDIVRQFKGVSGGFARKVVPLSHYEPPPSISRRNLSWNAEDLNKHASNYNTLDSANSISDNEDSNRDEHDQNEEESSSRASGWHSDNELQLKSLPPRIVKCKEVRQADPGTCGYPLASSTNSNKMEVPVVVPPEWMPPKISVPLLNLVDKIFQLKRRGWLRRQVFWISKQILQLVMEDAIDDFLLMQIHWIRKEDAIAQGIRWIQDAIWPDGVFYLRSEKYAEQHGQPVGASSVKVPPLASFEVQLEASRRANDIKKMIFDGAPAALVSLIGHKQYKRCANDIYYFLQSNICLKQLAYAILELVLISIFPELRDLVKDIHEKMLAQSE